MMTEEQAYELELERINASIDKMRRDYGELVTWRSECGHVTLDMPKPLAISAGRAVGPKRSEELRILTALLTPQIDRVGMFVMKSVLGPGYRADSGDAVRLVELAVDRLRFAP